VSGTRVTMAGDAVRSIKPIVTSPASRAGFKTALDVAIEKGNARDKPVQRPAASASESRWPAIDLSEITKEYDRPVKNGGNATQGRKKK